MVELTPPSSYHDVEYDFDRHPPVKIGIGDVLSLLKTVLTLRVLRTTRSILHIRKLNDGSDPVKPSSIHQAIDRREQRIVEIILSMTRDEFEDEAAQSPSRSSLSTGAALIKTITTTTTQDGLCGGDDGFLMRVSSTFSTHSLPTESTRTREVTQPVTSEGAKADGSQASPKERKRGSGFYSSLPPPISDSIYSSTLRRSLSVSNVHSVSSGPRQCMVVSAAHYTRMVSERPQFSIVSQPLSIDSLVTNESRVERSTLEIEDELRQTRSADSFPGEFPVSDGLEFSSLATASRHLRIPSMRTSVRPFSDL
ncbi:hypothetical protein P175DRAFT_028807 [Aspergillus ochraceoroseus IBT 24754]|uniref:Uncharacterized protein n=3 Tax=Aspergillus subgen. Nidulantes TaxID=2720870 RepID=A0A0F8XRB5_9EURO|nr:uncharacterized protein P175DRAFT_028807 [Aspergillus ochraceoroseus IBT 24754]KKK21409.1 hypothetical protein AOCH_006288 [Aspergillus ochraceoroseus]KKK26057.1 hypothetical protein ARAM_005113 [Aspergillus rambellii]PTU24326.1 hypothetical protein P175DRAFT_028807 [Aspergillus ochraceoroseus IBT 24754]